MSRFLTTDMGDVSLVLGMGVTRDREKEAVTDACYDRGTPFRAKRFLNDGAPQPKTVGNTPFFLRASRCVPRPWYFFIR